MYFSVFTSQTGKDIASVVSSADTVFYLPEFLSECFKKLQLRLGPANSVLPDLINIINSFTVETIDNIQHNTFEEGSEFNMNLSKVSDSTIPLLFDCFKLYYCCTSLQFLGHISLGTFMNETAAMECKNLCKTMSKNKGFKAIGVSCPNLTILYK